MFYYLQFRSPLLLALNDSKIQKETFAKKIADRNREDIIKMDP